MSITPRGWTVAAVIATIAAAVLVGSDLNAFLLDGTLASRAEAIIGMPLTPVSVAGVARRTTRRTLAYSGVYVATLPAGCVRVVVNDTSLYQCGATYYAPYGAQYTVVYVN